MCSGVPQSDSLCDPGQVTHHLWAVEASRLAQGRSAQWEQATTVGDIGVPHIWGLGSLVAGVGCVAKETSHHPSRRPGSY